MTETDNNQHVIIPLVNSDVEVPEGIHVVNVTTIEKEKKFDLKNASWDEIRNYVENKPYSEEQKDRLVKKLALVQRKLRDEESQDGFGI